MFLGTIDAPQEAWKPIESRHGLGGPNTTQPTVSGRSALGWTRIIRWLYIADGVVIGITFVVWLVAGEKGGLWLAAAVLPAVVVNVVLSFFILGGIPH